MYRAKLTFQLHHRRLAYNDVTYEGCACAQRLRISARACCKLTSLCKSAQPMPYREEKIMGLFQIKFNQLRSQNFCIQAMHSESMQHIKGKRTSKRGISIVLYSILNNGEIHFVHSCVKSPVISSSPFWSTVEGFDITGTVLFSDIIQYRQNEVQSQQYKTIKSGCTVQQLRVVGISSVVIWCQLSFHSRRLVRLPKSILQRVI